MGDDDLFEWFGGDMQGHHFVGTGGADDGLDWQMGFRGAVQFAVIQQWDDAGDKGIEADNNEYDFNAPCRSNPTLANLTLVGPNTDVATASYGIHLRRGTDAQIFNSIIIGWPSEAFRVQHNETVARGWLDPSGIACLGTDVADDQPVLADLGVRTFPNPAVEQARFAFELPQAGRASLSVYDLGGRLVEQVMDGQLSAGHHNIDWDLPEGTSPGAYFYRLNTDAGTSTGRLFVTN